MASTRTSYDPKAYQKTVYEMTSQLPIQLDPIRNERARVSNCSEPNSCAISTTTPFMPRHKNPVLVDTESDLMGITRPYSRDPSKQFPYAGVDSVQLFEPLSEVGMAFSARDTLLDYPNPNREKGLYPERFYNPILDLQRLDRIDDNSKIGMNTYLAETDHFKMFVPRPFNDDVLPKPSRTGMLNGAGDPFSMNLN